MFAVSALVCWDASGYNDRDSYVFPVTVAVAMALFSMLLMVRAVRGVVPPSDKQPQKTAPATAETVLTTTASIRRIAVAGGMLTAVVAMPIIGFFPAALIAVVILAVATLFVMPSITRMICQFIVLLAVTAGLYGLFVYVFQVPLPT